MKISADRSGHTWIHQLGWRLCMRCGYSRRASERRYPACAGWWPAAADDDAARPAASASEACTKKDAP